MTTILFSLYLISMTAFPIAVILYARKVKKHLDNSRILYRAYSVKYYREMRGSRDIQVMFTVMIIPVINVALAIALYYGLWKEEDNMIKDFKFHYYREFEHTANDIANEEFT